MGDPLSREAIDSVTAKARDARGIHGCAVIDDLEAETILALLDERARLERDNAALREVASRVVSAFVTHGIEVSKETDDLRTALCELQEVTGMIPGDEPDAWKATAHD